jgi:hypothetical protein
METDMDDTLGTDEGTGFTPANDGTDEVVVPAPGPVTVFVAGTEDEVDERLCVGWNAAGAPVVVGDNGGLRLLSDAELVRDVVW